MCTEDKSFEITLCKLYSLSQKCLILEDDKYLFSSPLQFNRKLIHLTLWHSLTLGPVVLTSPVNKKQVLCLIYIYTDIMCLNHADFTFNVTM